MPPFHRCNRQSIGEGSDAWLDSRIERQLHGLACAYFVINSLGHGNGSSEEVRVEMLALLYHKPGGWVCVSCQQRKYVIGSSLATQADQTEIWWVGTVVGMPSRLLIRIWWWHIISQSAWSSEVFADLVGSILNL